MWFVFVFKQETGYGMVRGLGGSEVCIRGRGLVGCIGSDRAVSKLDEFLGSECRRIIIVGNPPSIRSILT